MKLLTEQESSNKLQELSRSLVGTGQELRVNFESKIGWSAPIARFIVTLLGGKQPCFLWIREYGIWPSSENWDLFNALRAATADDRTLQQAPGHEVLSTEQERLVSYVQVILMNGWGGVLIGINKRQRIAISHDGWFSLMNADAMATQNETMAKLHLVSRLASEPVHLTTV